jgi:hypothetical protein
MVRSRSFCAIALVCAALFVAGGCHDDCDLEVETSNLPDGAVGDAYFFDLESDCGGDEWLLVDGSFLPPGITLNDDGELRGAPTVAGSFFFTVEVLEFDQFDTEHAFAGLSLEVLPAQGPAPTPSPTPN